MRADLNAIAVVQHNAAFTRGEFSHANHRNDLADLSRERSDCLKHFRFSHVVIIRQCITLRRRNVAPFRPF
jgi:hypothetical protein